MCQIQFAEHIGVTSFEIWGIIDEKNIAGAQNWGKNLLGLEQNWGG